MNSRSPNKQKEEESDKQGSKDVENTRVGSHIFNISLDNTPVDTGRKLNVHKTFNLCPASTGTWFLVLNLAFLF